MKKLVRRYLPPALQSLLRRAYYRSRLARKIYYFPQDCAGFLFKGRDGMRPPRSLISVGDGNFEQIGREYLGHFIQLGELKPHEHVLEIGCGIGRMAIPLTTFLSADGRYEGFDIVRPEIRWCREHITPRHPNFHFQHVDVRNMQTNRKGEIPAGSCRFPMDDGRFDFVFLTSVFTHMLLGDIENYLREISRVLKPGGRLLATFFLLDGETRERLRNTDSRFRYAYGPGLVIDPKIPEASIAHEEKAIRALLAGSGLRVREPLRYGSWSGRDEFLSSQDILVAEKAGSRPENIPARTR